MNQPKMNAGMKRIVEAVAAKFESHFETNKDGSPFTVLTFEDIQREVQTQLTTAGTQYHNLYGQINTLQANVSHELKSR